MPCERATSLSAVTASESGRTDERRKEDGVSTGKSTAVSGSIVIRNVWTIVSDTCRTPPVACVVADFDMDALSVESDVVLWSRLGGGKYATADLDRGVELVALSVDPCLESFP